jgi:hypothetical protein
LNTGIGTLPHAYDWLDQLDELNWLDEDSELLDSLLLDSEDAEDVERENELEDSELLDSELPELDDIPDDERLDSDRLDRLLVELDEPLEVELLELVETELELDELEEPLDQLEELGELELDDEELDEMSSIERIDNRSSLLGPGNCKSPVWKLSESARLTSPVVFVSSRVASQICWLGRVCVVLSTAPPSVAETSAAGAESSPARMCLVIVSTLEASPTAGPR